MASPKELAKAVGGHPWMVGGVVAELDSLLDCDGRPLSERRAPSGIKQGVTIELKACPYRDGRRGAPMNVSALIQITQHLDAVTANIREFRAGLVETGWSAMYLAIVDQLSGPGREVLQARSTDVLIPSVVSVGHKLAAGYFTVINDILAKEACGDELCPSVDGFLEAVVSSKALIGASEVCAGPMPLIRSATESLLLPVVQLRTEDTTRTTFARCLAAQFRLGLCWQLYDVACEKSLLLGEGPKQMPPTAINGYIGDALAARTETLNTTNPASSLQPELPAPETPAQHMLRHLLEQGAAASTNEEGAVAVGLLHDRLVARSGALRFERLNAIGLARTIYHYLLVLRSFRECLWLQEMPLRECYGFSAEGGLAPHSAVLPKPRALRWFEAALGYSLELENTPGTSVLLKRPGQTPVKLVSDSQKSADRQQTKPVPA